MDRRELLKMVAALTGGVVIGANSFLTGCNTEDKTGTSLTFSENDIAFLDEVADTILPTTKTPGAKAAKVGQFMTVMVNDCYEEKNQRIFHEGMGKLDDASKKKFDNSFIKLTPQQRHEMLIQVDKEKKDKWGLPVLAMDCEIKENEKQMRKDIVSEAVAMLEAGGIKDIKSWDAGHSIGQGIHEMGTARMGHDAKTSVVNKWNQLWDAKNVFVTDGSFMTSSACQNPSLTYMAFTARAVDNAVKELKKQNI